MNCKPLLMAALLLSMITAPAQAGRDPRPGSADARIKTLSYHENEVYRLTGHYGYTTVVEFSEREQIETISIGDSHAWQVIKPNRTNVLFIKPLEKNAQTNMTVLTSERIYSFDMEAEKASRRDAENLAFRIRFTYPNEAALALANIGGTPANGFGAPSLGSPAAWNFEYTYKGARRLRPERVFDDGVFTYFQFREIGTLPAIFAAEEDGSESLVNFAMRGPYLVVDRTAPAFFLRDGSAVTRIFNDAYQLESGVQRSAAPVGAIEEKSFADHPYPSPKPGIGGRTMSGLMAFLSAGEAPESPQARSYNE